MLERNRTIVFVFIAVLLVAGLAIALTGRANQQAFGGAVTPVSGSTSVLAPDEQATNEAVLARSRDLLKRCLDPSPTPSGLAEKIRQEVAQQEETGIENIAVMNEYTYENSVQDKARELPSFGDSVSIVIVQRINRPNDYKGHGYYIFAVDPATGKKEDLNIAGGTGAKFDRDRPSGPVRCTPEPTVKLEPTIITTVELTRMAATAATQ